MTPLIIRINIAASDAFIYAENLFLILKDGRVGRVTLFRIARKVFGDDRSQEQFLRIAFLRNDYYSNTQGSMFFGIEAIARAFEVAWHNQSSQPFEVELSDVDVEWMGELPHSSIVLDMRAYAMRLFIASSDSVHEIPLNFDREAYKFHPGKIRRVFDGSGMSLSAKGGEILVSSGHDGLVNGTISEGGKTRVSDRPIREVSFRCGWNGFNLLNYFDQSHFDYLINDTAKSDLKIERFRVDEGPTKRITKFGIKVLPGQSLERIAAVQGNSVVYAFNSSSSTYMYDTSGTLTISSILKEKGNEIPHLSSRPKTMKMGAEKRGMINRPVSHAIVPGGCVIEFFDRVEICQKNKVETLQGGAMLSTRSYINSVRYKNLVTTVSEEAITIFSIYPLDFTAIKRTPAILDEV